LIDVGFESLDGRPYTVSALLDPALANDGGDDRGTAHGTVLLACDGPAASALVAWPDFVRTESVLGSSQRQPADPGDGHGDRCEGTPGDDADDDAAPRGNVVQVGETVLDGIHHGRVTLALGFGRSSAEALGAAQASLATGFASVAAAYAAGWHTYLHSIHPVPATAIRYERLYHISMMILAAHEDKTYRGAYVASPTMPWAWGTPKLEQPSGAYHLVWSRDLYQIATALLAAGDRAGAERALRYLFERQQRPDGSFPQNSRIDGTPHWGNVQLDEVALPLVLAWQLGWTTPSVYLPHVKKAADYLVANGPFTQQERWENQSGYSPGTIAAEIAGLVCAADIARRNGDAAAAALYERTADDWQRAVERWTATTTGPYSSEPYYLRLTKDKQPDEGTAYDIGDSGPAAVDQRRVVDTSYLELVRLGVKHADDAVIRNTATVVDAQLAVDTPRGRFWHRFNFDGYGEQRDGGPWDIGFPAGSQTTIGRIWPIFAGERGEYELLAGGDPDAHLDAMAGTANEGGMMPEQVWDEHPPSGQPGFEPGTGTYSATPLAWTHAQFVRLAWSITHGHPVEQPRVVACRYVQDCP
jgi:glucoamylase